MFTILIILFVAYCAYKFFGGGEKTGNTPSQTKEREVGAIKDAARTLRDELKPIKEQVTTATTNARKAYEEAQHQRRIDALVSDPRLLADALEARASKQPKLTTVSEDVINDVLDAS